MVAIPLFGGLTAEVDAADVALVATRSWHAIRLKDTTYAASGSGSGGSGKLYMHRLIMGAGPGVEVDHRDGDGLNNRRSNLRCTTHRLNLANQRPQQGRSSRFKGVSFYRSRNRWEAYIRVNGRHVKLGYFDDEIEAAKAYDAAAIAAWGEFARTNFEVSV